MSMPHQMCVDNSNFLKEKSVLLKFYYMLTAVLESLTHDLINFPMQP